MADPEQRKLAAIMFTDMVSYSALAQRDESLALELLEEQRRIIREIVSRHHGREVKTTGDGFLLEFPSAVSAVRAAVEIQQSLHERNQAGPAGRQIQLRIGVHVGDVVVRDGDLHGDGVNIAARLEPLAAPGGICVSEDIEHQVRNKLIYPLETLGPTELKNIALPVHVHRVVLPWQASALSARPAAPPAGRMDPPPSLRDGRKPIVLLASVAALIALGLAIWRPWREKPGPIPPAAAATPALAPKPAQSEKSVAVLAFENLSDDKANEYFSDGVSEELLNVLAKVPGLKVSARTSSFYFKGRQVPLAEIAKQLGVAYVVEGSVRKAGNDVRITAQLIKASDGFHVWSDTFTRELKNVFAVQDEIAGLIAKKLELSMDDSAKSKLTKVNPEAYRLYLEGRREWNTRSSESLVRARVLFEQALAIDPAFAPALTGLADTIMIQDGQYSGVRNDPFVRQADDLLQRALKLDPQQAEAYATLGMIGMRDHDAVKADKNFKKAIELNPNYATAHHWYGLWLMEAGEPGRSLEELQRAADVDPLAPVIQTNYASGLADVGQPRRALALLDAVLKERPDFAYAKYIRAEVLRDFGRNQDAIEEYRKLLALPMADVPGGSSQAARRKGVWAVSLARLEGREACEKALAKIAPDDPNRHAMRAPLLLALGRADEALDELALDDTGELNQSSFLRPMWRPVYDNPKFRQILKQRGILEAFDHALAYAAAHPETAN